MEFPLKMSHFGRNRGVLGRDCSDREIKNAFVAADVASGGSLDGSGFAKWLRQVNNKIRKFEKERRPNTTLMDSVKKFQVGILIQNDEFCI